MSASEYTADITPSGAGNITIDVASAVAEDGAGNDNTAATQATVAYDADAPSVDIQGEPAIVNSTAAFSLTFQFSEDVTGFTLGDITVGNGSASNFATVSPSEYTADITPSGAGDVTIDVASAVAEDGAGNDNTAATQATVTYDATAPSIDIQGEPAIVNSTAAFSVTFQFSEDVTGFALGDITVGNGSVSNFATVSPSEYTADITPDGTGDVTIDVASAVAEDAASNDNTAATQATVAYDATAPSVDIQGEPAIVNSTAAFSVTFQFSEDVTGFAIGDITVGNGSASNFATVDANTYTADITPSGAGNITIDVAASVADDAAGNDNTAATQAVVTYDVTAPSVDIQGEPAIVNSTAAFSVTFQFSENVTGFTLGDITVGNGSASNFATVSASEYTADITPDGTGDVTIDVASAVAEDAASNDNTAATQATVAYDADAPSVDIQGEPAIVNSTAAFSVTFQFSEDVSNFVLGDITVGNGSASNFATVDANTYTADITPSGAGNITIDVAASVADDAAGNDNTAATQATVAYDADAPSVDIQGEPAIVNSTAAFSVTFQFSEDVSNFVLGDITVGNGSASNFATVSASEYTADITPDGTGDVTIDVASAVAEDAASNDNTAATQATVAYDAIAPSVDIQGEPTIVNNTSAFSVTFEFSEDVTGFALGDITVGNGSASNFATVSPSEYTADITPSGAGDVTIDVASAVAEDAASNDNTAATQATVAYDADAPSVDIQGEPAIVNSTAAFSLTFQFSEDVSNFALGDITVGNGSASNFATVSASEHTADITPSGAGDITIDVASAVAEDGAGNDNTAATQATVAYDADAPSVDIQGEPAIVNSTAAFSVTFQFSEDVSNFVLGDITVGNGSASNFATVDADTYTADITPSGAGNITIDVAASVADDAAGNDNTAATQAVVTYDATAPSIDIQGEPTIVNSTAAFSVTFQFSEDVTGFTLGDITVGNGSASNFATVSPSEYTADITPSGAGGITIDVASAVAEDAASNDNTAATQATVAYDAIAPSVDIQGEPTIVNNTSAFSVTFEFSEDVTGFALGDITVGNGSASNFATVSASEYTADITPSGAGGITIDVASAVAEDSAGNDNTAATQATVTYDATAPSIDIQGEPAIVNSTAAFSVTFQFSEDVTGFALGDITVGNGSVSNFATVSPSEYTADITPDGTGDVTIDVASAVAEDGAANDNTAATQATVSYDADAPSVDIQGEPAIVNSTAAFSVTFQFSEDVTGFTLGDITVGNGSASNFATVSASEYTADITPSGAGDITIDVASAVAEDGAGNDNTVATQAVTVYDVDAPIVLNVSFNSTLLTDAEVGPGSLVISIDFDKAMNNATSPTLAFDAPSDGGSLINCVGLWSDSDTYQYTCDLVDQDIEIENIDLLISGAQSLAGNEQVPYTEIDALSIDTIAGAPVITSPADGSTTVNRKPVISGTSEPDAIVLIYDGLILIGSTIASPTGTWSFTPLANLTVGIHSFSAIAFDLLGNVSPASASISIEILIDSDSDGITDPEDNCPLAANASQLDLDNDGQGDICDPDDDNDGIDDITDNCPLDANPTQADDDLDSIGNLCDPDYPRLPGSTSYSKWNTFLNQWNFLELTAQGDDSIFISVTVYNLFGVEMTSKLIRVDGDNEVDVDINALVKAACDNSNPASCSEFVDLDNNGIVDTYGMIKISYDDQLSNSQLLGRLSSYILDTDGNFSFAFARELKASLLGNNYATSNTFDVQKRGAEVINWGEIMYLGKEGDSTPKSFTVNRYEQDGDLLRTDTITLSPLQERDISLGHEELDEDTGNIHEAVYLVEVIPEDPEAEYLFYATRYGTKTENKFSYAFANPGRAPLGGSIKLYATTSAESFSCGQMLNWVEVANTLDTPVNTLLSFRNSAGSVIDRIEVTLQAKAQKHFNASAILETGEIGSVEIQSSTERAIIAQSVHYVFDCEDHTLQTAYMTIARPAGRRSQVGSVNSFLSIDSVVRANSTTGSDTNLKIDLETFLRENTNIERTLSAYSTVDFNVSTDGTFNFPQNRYGNIQLETSNSAEAIVEVLRVQKKTENGFEKIDFIMPTLIQ